MSTTWWFPDNTVLCNFAAVDRLDLLEAVLRGRGRWVEAIAAEVEKSAAYLPPLHSVAASGWLGEPIEIREKELQKAVSRTRRIVFAGTDEHPLEHLGEAQTCELIQRDPEYKDSWWITDDKEALRYAKGQGITTGETITIVSMAVIEGELSADEAFELMQDMADNDRGMRMPTLAKEFLL